MRIGDRHFPESDAISGELLVIQAGCESSSSSRQRKPEQDSPVLNTYFSG
jgi:hypothetical protein